VDTRWLADESGTIALGRVIGAEAQAGAIIALVGPMGAGKTHLTKGIAEGLGCSAEVTSPTFPLVHEYRGGRLALFHFDFYRLESPDDVLQIGWDEILDSGGVCVVEWADKFPHLLASETTWWRLTPCPDGRWAHCVTVDQIASV
jgi:tRNA threonylcarbamoyladenosine biosynthesis protein TsaE